MKQEEAGEGEVEVREEEAIRAKQQTVNIVDNCTGCRRQTSKQNNTIPISSIHCPPPVWDQEKGHSKKHRKTDSGNMVNGDQG